MCAGLDLVLWRNRTAYSYLTGNGPYGDDDDYKPKFEIPLWTCNTDFPPVRHASKQSTDSTQSSYIFKPQKDYHFDANTAGFSA